MVAAVDNLTSLVVTIEAREPFPGLAEWDLVVVTVTGAEPVDGYADLLSNRVGSRINLGVRRELLGPQGPSLGSVLRCRAALEGPNRILAEPHPEADEFSVTAAPKHRARGTDTR